MQKYESMFVVSPDASEASIEATRAKVKTAVTSQGGELVNLAAMGRRRLAYPIQRYREGLYSLCQFLGNGEVVREVDRVMGLDESVLRFLTVRVDEEAR